MWNLAPPKQLAKSFWPSSRVLASRTRRSLTAPPLPALQNAMARSSFGALVLAAAAAWLLSATLSPAFAGTRAQTASRADRVARQAGSEIMLTAPSIGGRYRVIIDESTTVESCLTKFRKIFEIDQDFLKDSDFNVYLKEDESKPISGKIADHTKLRPWGPDGIELHIYYEPK
ncbi:unnamed protein product [Prorocentrum cordatum]|nr:unnamed protein product [Polarella glacialis]